MIHFDTFKNAGPVMVFDLFEAYYRKHNAEDPISWPMELPTKDWIEALADFLEVFIADDCKIPLVEGGP